MVGLLGGSCLPLVKGKMVLLSQRFGAVVVIFSTWVLAQGVNGLNNDLARDLDLESRDDDLPQAGFFGLKQSGGENVGAIPLDGRSLIDSWLGRRAQCADSGYSPCTS